MKRTGHIVMEVTMNAQMSKVHTGRMTAARPHTLIASDRVEGTPVRRPTGEKIGTVQRVMIDKISGNVAYAVLAFGGFLGMGRKHLPIPWSRLNYDLAQEAYVVDLSDEELERAPDYEADETFDWGDRRNEIVMRNYYRSPHYWGM
jgi:hypothetical protein